MISATGSPVTTNKKKFCGSWTSIHKEYERKMKEKVHKKICSCLPSVTAYDWVSGRVKMARIFYRFSKAFLIPKTTLWDSILIKRQMTSRFLFHSVARFSLQALIKMRQCMAGIVDVTFSAVNFLSNVMNMPAAQELSRTVWQGLVFQEFLDELMRSWAASYSYS